MAPWGPCFWTCRGLKKRSVCLMALPLTWASGWRFWGWHQGWPIRFKGWLAVSTTGHEAALRRTHSPATNDQEKWWRLLEDIECKTALTLCVSTIKYRPCTLYKNKNTIYHTVQQPAVAAQLFQSGQHQSGHHMVRHQHASFYVGLHQHTCLWYTTDR